MCYIQVKNIRLNSFYEEKKIKLCLTKQLLNMFKLWCEWGISYLYVKLQWNRSHVGMEVEQSSRPDSKPLRNILWLQAEQNFVSLITLHLPSILKIHSIGTWLFNLSKITFIIYKPWHLPEKSSGPQLGYSSRSVTRCISFENRSPPSQAETQTNSALNKKLKFVSFSYNKLTDVSHQTMHQY